MPFTMKRNSPRQAKLVRHGVTGRMVSAKSKTGDPKCSLAMSAFQTFLQIARGMQRQAPEMNRADAIATLAQCRSKAHALKMAAAHRKAGNIAHAEHIEHQIRTGRPVTARARTAKAAELRQGRARKIEQARQAHAQEKARQQRSAATRSAVPSLS